MLAIGTAVAWLLGIVWMVDAYLNFRIESLESLYLFDRATREIGGITLLVMGAILAWLEHRQTHSSHHS